MIENGEDFVERRQIHRVVIDSLENGAAKSLSWIVRGLWTIVVVIVTGAFWMGTQSKQIDVNTMSQMLIIEQHTAILEALARIGANQNILLEERSNEKN